MSEASTSEPPRWTGDLRDQLENAIRYPKDRGYFTRQAMQVVDRHPNREEMLETLELAEELDAEGRDADAENALRGAYGLLVPPASGGEE